MDKPMDTENKNQPAFPVNEVNSQGQPYYDHLGLTKREYFAAMAMQGMIASGWTEPQALNEIAKRSVAAAEVLLNQLNQ